MRDLSICLVVENAKETQQLGPENGRGSKLVFLEKKLKIQETTNKAMGITEKGEELWETTLGSLRNVYFAVPIQEK